MMHQMILSAQYSTGAQEWTCPSCGRMFIMQWEPFRKIILVEGDVDAQHAGGIGGISIQGVSIESKDTTDDLPTPFDDYFRGIGWLDEKD